MSQACLIKWDGREGAFLLALASGLESLGRDCGYTRFALRWCDAGTLEIRGTEPGRTPGGGPWRAGGVLAVAYCARSGATSAQWYNLLGRVLALRARWEGDAGEGVLADDGPQGSGEGEGVAAPGAEARAPAA